MPCGRLSWRVLTGNIFGNDGIRLPAMAIHASQPHSGGKVHRRSITLRVATHTSIVLDCHFFISLPQDIAWKTCERGGRTDPTRFFRLPTSLQERN